MAVQAYYYCGDWVGDCTREGCANTEHLFRPRSPSHPVGPANRRTEKAQAFFCSNCLQVDSVDWPDPEFMDQVARVLALRPVPQNRNWYPADHPAAVNFRLEHGQSITDLRRENIAHGVPA